MGFMLGALFMAFLIYFGYSLYEEGYHKGLKEGKKK